MTVVTTMFRKDKTHQKHTVDATVFLYLLMTDLLGKNEDHFGCSSQLQRLDLRFKTKS